MSDTRIDKAAKALDRKLMKACDHCHLLEIRPALEALVQEAAKDMPLGTIGNPARWLLKWAGAGGEGEK